MKEIYTGMIILTINKRGWDAHKVFNFFSTPHLPLPELIIGPPVYSKNDEVQIIFP